VLFNEQYHLPPLVEAVFVLARDLRDKDLNEAVMRFKPNRK
jgi:hypothetical protein